ncbi:MAG: glycosyltransferase [Actinomycetales bacterium]|nr:glycosyltransferase [Actinomycetales bacterium]
MYQGEDSLPLLLEEINPLTRLSYTPGGHSFTVTEVLLVSDNGPDGSDRVMRELADKYEYVRPIWLSRNFGQHAATLAGMASTNGEWIVTLDEDGQHDPQEISLMLDEAMSTQSSLIYGKPTNPAPHGFLRNWASKFAKKILAYVSGNSQAPNFQSFRLILGSVGRSVAAYAGSGVYLDIALGWVTNAVSTSPITLREGVIRPSGYSPRRLIAHFSRMLLSSGTRGLRFVSGIGITFAIFGIAVALFILIARLSSNTVPAGWASTIVVVLISSGVILLSLGIVAEYVGVNVNMAMGRPPYVIMADPLTGPLGRIVASAPFGQDVDETPALNA